MPPIAFGSLMQGRDLVARLEPQQRAFLSDRFRALSGEELREMQRLAELTLQGLPPPKLSA